jgi:hypothetical protein
VIVLPMRKAGRVVVLFFLGLLSSVFVGVAIALTSAVSLAATALIVPGTGTHNITTVIGYKENAADRFIAPSTTAVNACTSTNGCVLDGIDYPASFWPIPLPGWCPGLTCDTWNESVGTGVTNLNSELNTQLANPTPANAQIIIFGYSQGGAVVSREMYNLANLDPAIKQRITVVTIGNINNPQGLWSRLGFLPTIPILDVSFGPQLPTNIGIKSINYSFEYDPVGDAPLYWGNPLAMLNAILAFEYVHGYYLAPNSNDPGDQLPYGYTDETLATAIQNAPHRTYQDATFVLIPQQGTLPLMRPIVDLAASTGTTAFVKPFVDLVSPVLKELINLGYDRAVNPGVPQTLSILPFNPFQNWVEVGVRLVVAAGQGVQAFLGDLGVPTVAPPAPAPSAPAPVSTLAEESGDELDPVIESEPESQGSAGTSALRVVKKQTDVDETVVQEDDETLVVDETETAVVVDEAVIEEDEIEGESPVDEKATDGTATNAKSATKPEETKPEETKPVDGQKADDEKKAADDADKDADNEKAAA